MLVMLVSTHHRLHVTFNWEHGRTQRLDARDAGHVHWSPPMFIGLLPNLFVPLHCGLVLPFCFALFLSIFPLTDAFTLFLTLIFSFCFFIYLIPRLFPRFIKTEAGFNMFGTCLEDSKPRFASTRTETKR